MSHICFNLPLAAGDILYQTIQDTDIVLVSKMFPDDSGGLTVMYNSTTEEPGMKYLEQGPYIPPLRKWHYMYHICLPHVIGRHIVLVLLPVCLFACLLLSCPSVSAHVRADVRADVRVYIHSCVCMYVHLSVGDPCPLCNTRTA